MSATARPPEYNDPDRIAEIAERISPEDLETFLDDLYREPEAKEIARRELDAEAERFLVAAVKFARTIQLSDYVWQSRRILADSMVWLLDAQGRLSLDIAVRQRPAATTEAFSR